MGIKSKQETALEPGTYIPGEVLVQFEQGIPRERVDAILGRLNLSIKKSLGGKNTYLLAINDATPLETMIARLNALPEVDAAGPNRLTHVEPPRKGPRTYAPRSD